MEICSFGVHADGVEFIHAASTRTLLDFDVLLVDPSGIGGLDHQHIVRQKSEITEFLAKGGIVFWFVQAGTIHHLLPIDQTTADAFSGTKTEFVGHPPFRDFWYAVRNLMEYKAVLRGAGTPILRITNTEKVVASWRRVSAGAVILLPALKPDSPNEPRARMLPIFLQAARVLVEHLAPKRSDFEPPAWSAAYSWPSELKLRRRIAELKEIANQTEVAMTGVSKELIAEERLKVLLAGTGDQLVDAVIDAFQMLGAEAERGESGRDDIILNYEGRYAVVEVKGKKSSAAEKDAAQLEKWVAGFKEERETDAKGLLVVNAYCQEPPDQRTAPPFPHQMLKYCEQREHCLLTSTQLLGMILLSRGKTAKADRFLKRVFATVGIFDELSDYKQFLRHEPETNVDDKSPNKPEAGARVDGGA